MKKKSLWMAAGWTVVAAAIILIGVAAWFLLNREEKASASMESKEGTDTQAAVQQDDKEIVKAETVEPSWDSAEEEQTQEAQTQKRLIRVECRDENGALKSERIYQYDASGRLVKVCGQVLTYDDEGNLLWQVSGEPCDQVRPGFNAGVRYQYNSQGQMINEFHWEGGGTETVYEYDDSGKLSKSYDINDFLNTECTYYYDTQGFLVKTETTGAYTTGEKYSEICHITTDEQGRPIAVSVTENGQERVTVYYEYLQGQLVIAEYTYANEEPYYCVELCNAAGQRLDCFAEHKAPCSSITGDGYLEIIEQENMDGSTDEEYRFIYEDV